METRMYPTKLFISYPRAAADEVRGLAGHLEQLGQDVWLDQELNGGQEWWDTILERIRSCDCFMYTLCEDALQSKACRAELDYAYQTHRVILPMAVGPPVPDQVLPRYLSKLQRVDTSDPMQVARALLHLPDPRPLPSPLPEPPPVPISYLDELADVVERPSLSMSDQHNLVGTLKQRLAHDEDRDAALTLLHRLRRRSDVYAGVAEEVDAELARHEVEPEVEDEAEHAGEPGSASGNAGGPQAENVPPGTVGPPFGAPYPLPPPVAQGPARARGKVVAVVAAGVLALGGVGGAVALGGGNDEPNPPTTSTSEQSTAPPTDDVRPPPVDPVELVVVTPGQLPDDYGDDPYLDELADYCYAGSLEDCDVLYQDSPSGSAYETFGATCGAVSYVDFSGGCALEFDADLNAGVEACDAGDMALCDALYWAAPVGSLYEAFGAFCGLRSDEPLIGSCEATFSA
jgi:TIR domain